MRRFAPQSGREGERWSALPAAPTVTLLLGRRAFLQALGVLLAALAAPISRVERAWAARRGKFFTAHERATLAAYVDRIIPPDHDPGAKAFGVPRYIEELLTALDGSTPRIFAGGPYSGRTPFPDNNRGVPGKRRPKDSFRHFLPLTRLQALAWRAELFGSAGVPEIAALDAQNPPGTPLIGLRDVYRTSLQMIDEVATQAHGKAFVRLSTADQDDVFTKMEGFTPDPRRDTFNNLVITHTLEGCFGAPEYGGNVGRRGWKMLGLEGDSQPLGYSIFDRSTDAYKERATHRMTTINPDEKNGPKPLTADGTKIQQSIEIGRAHV